VTYAKLPRGSYNIRCDTNESFSDAATGLHVDARRGMWARSRRAATGPVDYPRRASGTRSQCNLVTVWTHYKAASP
jgi:hypothetical protein